ncbi:hypothetical protein KZZ08_00700 [Roseovarius mucosus]|uniref:hypothetical protein n=1 Tax=Roseovarius mucosus TaxID=215743 RepID=UPI001C5EC9B6|nr:hypothetical protein [Roseovarius mucosus]MBW4972115.1 hypothetical protein [Roseovarius mucosus]
MQIAKVENDEIVIRIPLTAMLSGFEGLGFVVTNAQIFAPHVARELSDEDTGERLYVEPFLEAAMIRAAEGDAPGIRWDDDSAEDQALHEADNDRV